MPGGVSASQAGQGLPLSLLSHSFILVGLGLSGMVGL